MPVPRLLLATLSSVLAAASFAADVAYSPVVGGMAFQISGGSLAAPVTTRFALPLVDFPAASGVGVGAITSVTSTSVTVTGAGWVGGALSTTSFPYAIRFTSGSAEGVTLPITANTADTLTTSGRDLVALGVTAGDKFRLVPIDTLNSLFGSSTFLGGANVASADVVTLSSSVALSYYYNTSLSRWVRTTGPTTDRGDIQIPPDSVIAVTRKGGAIDLVFTGIVSNHRFAVAVANSGSTYTHAGFPTDVTLAALALQNRIPGWVSNAAPGVADTLAVSSGGTWLTYFFNGSNWQRTTGPATNRDSIVIPAGAAIQIFKRGSASGTTDFTRSVPF